MLILPLHKKAAGLGVHEDSRGGFDWLATSRIASQNFLEGLRYRAGEAADDKECTMDDVSLDECHANLGDGDDDVKDSIRSCVAILGGGSPSHMKRCFAKSSRMKDPVATPR